MLSMLIFNFRLKYKLLSYVKKLPIEVSKKSLYIIGGKHLRSTLMKKVASICGISESKIFLPAAVLEMIHTATIIQDDIIDSQKKRRGSNTINSLFKDNITTLCADQILAEIINDFSSYPYSGVPSYFIDQSINVCLGELEQDFNLDITKKCSVKSCLEVVKLKTGVLFSISFKTPALLANYNKELISFIENCGYLYGMIYQLVDDYNDMFYDIGSNIQKINHWTLPLLFWRKKDKVSFNRFILGKIKNPSNDVDRYIKDMLYVEIDNLLKKLKKEIIDFDIDQKKTASKIYVMMLTDISRFLPFRNILF